MSFLVALVLTWLHLTVLAILSSISVVWQLVMVVIVLAFRYERPIFGWRVALISGILFDLFSGLRFGVFTFLFLMAAILSELAWQLPERWGVNLTSNALAFLLTMGYVIVTMWIVHYDATTILVAAVISAIITTLTTYLVASLIDKLSYG